MLPADTMLGPYRIIAPIGAGGMGEVYRALDPRLGREVAIKVLAPGLAHDAESLRRFEQEARAAGMLNHPNILTIYDIGSDGPTRYIVSELLIGESLRARLRVGAIPVRKALEYGVQVARGLAAAHAKGIIHRDLKPENLFVTGDGQVKILDFGLVKLMGQRLPGVPDAAEDDLTIPASATEPGRILGTVGYMSPEQIRGTGGDHRSDIFAFGTILYEMLAGRPPFRGDSPIETLNAILRDEPAELYDLGLRVPPQLERLIRHATEKNPEERFQSARDLAFDLASVAESTTQTSAFSGRFPRVRWRRLTRPLLFLGAALLATALGFVIGRQHGQSRPPSYRRLTFRTGTIVNARFSPDGQTVFYGAKWGGNPVNLFAVRPESPESKDLGLGTADVLSVSSTGQLAISLRRHPIGFLRESGTLAQVPISGGSPRELLEDVETADWAPGGAALAVVRTVKGRCRLEYPIGHVLYETHGWLSHPRFSPRGDYLAFVAHPLLNDDRGDVWLIDIPHGKNRRLTTLDLPMSGLAWQPRRNEVWFAAERSGMPRGIHAVTLSGREREIATNAGAVWLQDIAPDGRVLVTHEDMRGGIVATMDGASARDLSWLDYSVVRDLSADGKRIIFSESGDAGGALFGVYLRSTDGSPAIRLGDGTSESLSPDGRWVLSIPRNRSPAQIVMLPTGAGQARSLTSDSIDHHFARWFPDGRTFLFSGRSPGHGSQLWTQTIDGGTPRAITPENVSGSLVTPDGTKVLGRASDRRFYFYPVGGGLPIHVSQLRSGDVPVRFADDGPFIYVATFGHIPAVMYRVNLNSGERTVWREAMPADPSGLINVGPILITPDGRESVYSFTRLLSELYLIEGLR